VVGRNIGAERLDGAQTIPRDNFICCGNYFLSIDKSIFYFNLRTSFAFDELDADVVLLGTPLSGVPVPVERRAAAGVRGHASVAVRPAETCVHDHTYCIRRAN